MLAYLNNVIYYHHSHEDILFLLIWLDCSLLWRLKLYCQLVQQQPSVKSDYMLMLVLFRAVSVWICRHRGARTES